MSVAVPVDQPARDRITTTGLADTLFVEAGAGTGKTSTLVARLVRLVTHEQVALREVAAITFTEAAAAELRDRVRRAFEAGRAAGDPVVADRCREALADLDGAAIATLHAFARRILSEHPIEVSIPPRVDVLDEVQSTLAFEARWRDGVARWLAEPTFEPLIVRLHSADVQLQSSTRASLKDVARVLDANWDRLEDIDLGPVRAPSPLDRRALHAAIDAVFALADHCLAADDLLLAHLERITRELHEVRAADPASDDLLVRLLTKRGKWTAGRSGKQANWPDVDTARAAFVTLDAAASALRGRAVDEILAAWLVVLRDFTLAAARERRDRGELEFHDLLVLARRLLRTSDAARRALHERYTRLLLDEFQDTDPIQIELAMLIAAEATSSAGGALADWSTLLAPSGRVFVVGDPKQSIYRFRRADIALFQRARDVFGVPAHVALVANFRTVAPIVAWVNGVFGALMPEERAGQPRYAAIAATRQASDAVDHQVCLYGTCHEDDPDAATLREREAADVAAIVQTIRRNPASRPVWHVGLDGVGAWRPATCADVTVLIPSRQSLPMLEAAFAASDVPYRIDSSTLVFDSPEIRDLLSIVAAVDDPSDELATVAALRSPVLACNDRELFAWVQAGGSWDYRDPAPSAAARGAVAEAMAALAGWHDSARWCEPATLLESIVRTRDVFALALAHRRPRDAWRRVRFLIDQARCFADVGGGHLRAFLEWTALQRREGSRVPEPLLPETDDDAVRVMTFHGAKGLEFPIVVLSGLTTVDSVGRRGPQVHWDAAGRPEVRLNADAVTENFDVLNDFESEMDADEKLRLLYVGATRARDHLFVSTHRKPRNDDRVDTHAARMYATSASAAPGLWQAVAPVATLAALAPLIASPAPAPATVTFPPATADPRVTAEAFVGWCAGRERLLAAGGARSVWSATALAEAIAAPPATAMVPASAAATVPAAPVGGDDVSDAIIEAADTVTRDGLTARTPGRGGTAFGRAVHAVLQFASPDDLAGVAALVARAVVDEALPADAIDDVHRAVARVFSSPTTAAAFASPRQWREVAVCASLGPTPGAPLLEGFVDLLAEIDGSLVLVDYKTDRVEVGALEALVARYAPQLAAYAEAIEVATGRVVDLAVLVFAGAIGATAAIECTVVDLPAVRRSVVSFVAQNDR